MLFQKPASAPVRLIRSISGTGYKCVFYVPRKNSKLCYVVKLSRNDNKTIIDRFATAEEAALCYATLTPEGREDAAKLASEETLLQMQNMPAAEARATAAKEGLELQPGGGGSGFACVFLTPNGCRLPFVVQVLRAGKRATLGHFASAEAAALCYARSPEGRAAAEAKLAEAQAPPPLTAEAALAAAAAEGLVLPSCSSRSRFVGVYAWPEKLKLKLPFRASYSRDGLEISLGFFATAEEAALCRARELAAQADAPAADDELALTCPICLEPIDADSHPLATTCQHIYSAAARAARCWPSAARARPSRRCASVRTAGLNASTASTLSATSAAAVQSPSRSP